MRTAIAAAVSAATGLGISIALAQEKESIRVGVLYPTSGFGQIFGAPALLGHDMMIEQINTAGGINGRKIVSIHRDSKLQPAEATAAARDLRADPRTC